MTFLSLTIHRYYKIVLFVVLFLFAVLGFGKATELLSQAVVSAANHYAAPFFN